MSELILADRSDLFRRAISSVLVTEGYAVSVAETGSRVISLCHEKHPSAIILDMETPDPGSLETLLMLKSDPKLRRTPVIVVSREGSPATVSNAFRIGAETFMLKPIDLNTLLKTLESLQIHAPELGSLLEIAFGEARLAGKLRFIDAHGLLYLDKDLSDFDEEVQKVWDPRIDADELPPGAPIGELGTVTFELGKGSLRQRVVLVEENAQGLVLFPVGSPVASGEPACLTVPVRYKARYLVPGSFMKLADVQGVNAEGFLLAIVGDEPRPMSPVQVTIYSQNSQGDGGIPLSGKITATRRTDEGTYACDVALTEAGGAPFVNLLAELIGGRPPHSA